MMGKCLLKKKEMLSFGQLLRGGLLPVENLKTHLSFHSLEFLVRASEMGALWTEPVSSPRVDTWISTVCGAGGRP